MRYLVMAILLITFPAIVVMVYGLLIGNLPMVWATAASLFLGAVPFLVAGWVYRSIGRDPDAGPEH
ncbi:hypothetical protein BH23GEM4_BH23GEM4_22100 [soil metagenome]|jgi:cytochrome bd-type quinol oxidase subunit 1